MASQDHGDALKAVAPLAKNAYLAEKAGVRGRYDQGKLRMADDPNQVVVLATVPTEAQAGIIVTTLEDHGVQARTTGALTNVFRADAPGGARFLSGKPILSGHDLP